MHKLRVSYKKTMHEIPIRFSNHLECQNSTASINQSRSDAPPQNWRQARNAFKSSFVPFWCLAKCWTVQSHWVCRPFRLSVDSVSVQTDPSSPCAGVVIVPQSDSRERVSERQSYLLSPNYRLHRQYLVPCRAMLAQLWHVSTLLDGFGTKF